MSSHKVLTLAKTPLSNNAARRFRLVFCSNNADILLCVGLTSFVCCSNGRGSSVSILTLLVCVGCVNHHFNNRHNWHSHKKIIIQRAFFSLNSSILLLLCDAASAGYRQTTAISLHMHSTKSLTIRLVSLRLWFFLSFARFHFMRTNFAKFFFSTVNAKHTSQAHSNKMDEIKS